jgi:hypothetical protein
MLKVLLKNKVVGLTKLDKTYRNVGLLCAVFNVMSYSWLMFRLLIRLLYYIP